MTDLTVDHVKKKAQWFELTSGPARISIMIVVAWQMLLGLYPVVGENGPTLFRVVL